MPDMDGEKDALIGWLSTYQWMTVGRLLSDYGFDINDADVVEILSHKTSFYYQMLTIPMMNVLNGIILDQTKEYQLFLQKLFVDYLMSGESDKSAEEPGSVTRKDLDEERSKTIAYSKEFEQVMAAHEDLIVHSQIDISQFAELIMTRLQAIHDLVAPEINTQKNWHADELQTCFVDADGFKVQLMGLTRLEKHLAVVLSDKARELLMHEFNEMAPQEKALELLMSKYVDAVREQRVLLNGYRTKFYEWIGTVQNLLYQAAPYRVDEAQDMINRERLFFDSKIGAIEDGE
ncbi:MAG: hypothetical protein NTW08_08265 [Gammaproteobacteria bacterium]|nr:hypothetical protein [Gammaproteobacteria bacterium]